MENILIKNIDNADVDSVNKLYNHYIKENENNKIINLSFPNGIFNQIKSIKIVGQNHAGAKYYFDDFSKKKTIAILSNNEFYKVDIDSSSNYVISSEKLDINIPYYAYVYYNVSNIESTIKSLTPTKKTNLSQSYGKLSKITCDVTSVTGNSLLLTPDTKKQENPISATTRT